MSFNTDWDVDAHKTEHESEEHWELRRSFMVKHKYKFREERLVCLAQVFTNIEFLGCRYPAETMALVEELSQGVADTYREKQKTKLQRTFVKASDAAGAKVKGLKRPLGDAAGPSDSPPKIPKYSDNVQLPRSTSTSTNAAVTINSPPSTSFSSDTPDKNSNIKPANNTNSEVSQVIKTCTFVRATETTKISLEDEKNQESNDQDINGCVEKSVCKPSGEVDQKARRKEAKLTRKANRRIKKGISQVKNHKDLISEMEIVNTGKFGRLILLEDINNENPHNTLTRSTSQCNIPFQIQYSETAPQEVYCKVFVNNHLLTTCCGFNKKEARIMAMSEAYEKLRQICYILKVKSFINTDGTVIEKDPHKFYSGANTGTSLNRPLGENVGSKLMRAMGWTGGGLGKDQQGIEEPIRITKQVERSGFGLPEDNYNVRVFQEKISAMLLEYADNDEIYDLVFSSEFTKEERAVMHSVSLKYHLKSKSYGRDKDRRIVISKRKDYCRIVENMVVRGEYSTPSYELIKPPILLTSESKDQSQPDCESNVKSENVVVNPTEPSTQSLQEPDDSNVSKEKLSDVVETPHEIDSPGDTETKASISLSNDFAVQNNSNIIFELTGPFGLLILIEDETVITPIMLIERSASRCHIPFKFEYANTKEGMTCKLLINNILVASSTEVGKKRAREVTVNKAVKKLKNLCFALETQIKVIDNTVSVTRTLKKPNKRPVGIISASQTSIVCVSKEVNWRSLDLDPLRNGIPSNAFRDKVRNFLQNYLLEKCPYDLVISPDLSVQEKSFIRQAAASLALKSMKYEALRKEFVVLSKKPTIVDLAKAMLTSGGNASTDSIQNQNRVAP